MVLAGLKKVDLNGARGTIVSETANENGRWAVRIAGGTKLVKGDNLVASHEAFKEQLKNAHQPFFEAIFAEVHYDELPRELCSAEIIMSTDKELDFTREDLVQCASYGVHRAIQNAAGAARVRPDCAARVEAFIAVLEGRGGEKVEGAIARLHAGVDGMLADFVEIARNMERTQKLVVHLPALQTFVYMRRV